MRSGEIWIKSVDMMVNDDDYGEAKNDDDRQQEERCKDEYRVN